MIFNATGIFLTYCILDSLFIVLVKKYSSILGIGTLEFGCYANVFAFFFLLPFVFKNLKTFIRNVLEKWQLIILLTGPIMKLLILKDVPVVLVSLTTFLIPIFVILFSFIFLKEYSKYDIASYAKSIILFLCIVLFCLSYDSHFKITLNSILVLSMYILFKSIYQIMIKQKSKDTIHTLVVIKFFYVILSIIIFYFNSYTFDYRLMFSHYVMIVGSVTILCYFTMIYAFSLSKISNLQYLKYTQIIFATALGYLFLDESINLKQSICIGILCCISLLDFDKMSKRIHRYNEKHNARLRKRVMIYRMKRAIIARKKNNKM